MICPHYDQTYELYAISHHPAPLYLRMGSLRNMDKTLRRAGVLARFTNGKIEDQGYT